MPDSAGHHHSSNLTILNCNGDIVHTIVGRWYAYMDRTVNSYNTNNDECCQCLSKDCAIASIGASVSTKQDCPPGDPKGHLGEHPGKFSSTYMYMYTYVEN